MQLDTLYKQGKTGAIQVCNISAIGDTVIVEFGQLNGKMQSKSTVCTAKNVGRANETSPAQQAILEAQAKHVDKIKSGYSYDKSAPVTVQLPMKVKAYQDQLHNVKFPCVSTPKLNGINAIFKHVNGKLIIYSRGGEVYPPIPHIEPEVSTIMHFIKSNELNGELYIHGEHLQDIQSAVKKPNELSKRLEFAIFDIADSKSEYIHRRNSIIATAEAINQGGEDLTPNLSFLTGVICNSHEDIETHYNQCIASKLEGTVIKNFDGLYKHNVRSSDQFKYKKAQSAEFLIVSYELDKNSLPVFILESAGGDFKAKPIGTKEYWSQQIPATYIGQYATCEYEVFSKSGIPLKPIFISTRKLDASGNPLE